MKRFALIALALCCTAFGQQNRLSPATPVDIRVTSVQWHPHGDSLLYSRDEESGIGIGLYNLGDPEGKVVLHLGAHDRWNADWFEGKQAALVTVQRQVTTAQGAKKEVAVYLLGCKQKTSYEVFSKIVNTDVPLSVDADLSPSLLHAIVTITEGKNIYHEVLPVSGGMLVASSDIDEAVKQGCGGPSWSKDGTAIFSQGGNSQFEAFTNKNSNAPQKTVSGTSDAAIEIQGSKSQSFTLTLSEAGDASKLINFVLMLRPMAPPAGVPVLEVVPANGVLRQVLSPGPWVSPQSPATTLRSQTHQSWLDFGQARGWSTSLWLMQGEKEAAKGTLVAAHADSAEIAPEGKAIEFIVDGALFVRRLNP